MDSPLPAGVSVDGGNRAFAAFLRDRRRHLDPASVGLPVGRRRRTPGLRREEVAQLADIGTAWYTALEQGRDVRPSDQVLANLARALRLTAVERDHLFTLAGRRPPARLEGTGDGVDAQSLVLLRRLEPDPAYIVDARWDVLAWNQGAADLFRFDAEAPAYARNMLWRYFTRSPSPEERSDWNATARALASIFRGQSAAHANDPRFRTLIDDLLAASDTFRRVWPGQEVRALCAGRKWLDHPLRGRQEYDFVPLSLPSMPGASLMVYLARPAAADSDTGIGEHAMERTPLPRPFTKPLSP
ncbi:helix-turn-helix transcriptional regulator [Nitrospirillum amazonense]|uniref:Transcriptional regulator with XRE-family HTH domain n=1 Tax=Nitrospirillum amazonense TaxID=28077 RepID=A0A560K2W0_9PROT|nr:helix-turn-helix transcriptional regulator [Nitrospirillum amazonense]MDG3444118.1 helix-turn-helix transcriptional regulator [Nitrospirillum amazonense]TWB77673.1 transcriptional regulator with XRE-family HTH domain [Nitrospirillum amazonense]